MLCTSPWLRFELVTSVVIGTDCIDSCKPHKPTHCEPTIWFVYSYRFQIIWPFLITVISETCRVYYIRYLRFYLCSVWSTWYFVIWFNYLIWYFCTRPKAGFWRFFIFRSLNAFVQKSTFLLLYQLSSMMNDYVTTQGKYFHILKGDLNQGNRAVLIIRCLQNKCQPTVQRYYRNIPSV